MRPGKRTRTPPPTQQGLLPLASPSELLVVPDYISAEVFLENSGFFTPSSKRVKGIYTKEKVVGEKPYPDGTVRVVKTKISANYELGLPITSDFDYYRAFLKVCDEIVDRDGRFRLPITVPTRQLIRYAGKVESPKERQEAKRWLERMTGTLSKGGLYRAKHKDYDDGFAGTVFSQVILRGNLMKNGKIAETNYIWPSPWFLSNYFYRHLKSIDFNLHQRLRKPIAKALYPLLETGWYASSGKPYAKSYRDLCQEFLLVDRKHISRIKEQLDPSHRELVRERFLARWEYRKAASQEDYIVTYWPGAKFFEDQQAREIRRQLAEQLTQKSETRANPVHAALNGAEQTLLEEILAVCGDTGNQPAYRKVIREHPEGLLWMAISETRQATRERLITKTKGAYFMATVKDLAARWAAAPGMPPP
jgi:hypothetical protein